MARINAVDRRTPNLAPGALRVAGGQIIESDGSAAGVYNVDIFIPAYALVVDAYVHAEALFTAGTSATLDVGFWSVSSGVISTVIDVDDIYDAVDLKATDMAAGEAFNISFAGGKHGNFAGVVATQDKLVDAVDAVDRFLRFQLTTVGTVGTAGKAYVYVLYALPEMDSSVFTAT